MKIPLKENLAVAEKVRRAVNRLNKSPKLVARGHFECFDNCREQGFVLKLGDGYDFRRTFNIAFSENRNSDDIVVYCYVNTRFPQNLPATDADWAGSKYFPHKKYDQAAQYIIDRAIGFLEPVV